jgi:hypothetical protein
MKPHYTLHNFECDKTDKEEIPKVMRVEYTRWSDEPHRPISWVARYELVEVVPGELPRKKYSERTSKIADKMMEEFLEEKQLPEES